MKKIIFYIFFVLFPFVNTFGQFTIPELPAKHKQTSVYDYADLLNSIQKQTLEQKLIRYADTTSNQIVIAVIPTLKGEYEGELAPKWAHEWGIGDKDKDNGVFILLAMKERKIWIAPGYGLEHILTAARNGEIIRNEIIPQFRKGNFYAGLDIGTTRLIQLFNGSYKASPRESSGNSIFPILIILFIVVILIIIFNKRGKNGGNFKGGRKSNLLDILILSSMGSSRGFGAGGNTGGFSGGFGGGFGGGGFSGGGAGGGW